jgi:hypothetical protein
MAGSREHIFRLCLAPELRLGIIKLSAKKEISETYAALWLLNKALHQEQLISHQTYEILGQKYSCPLVPPTQQPKLTDLEMKEQQKLDEKRRWFEACYIDFFKDHRKLSSGKTWHEDVLAEAEKYKYKLPIAAKILALRSS